VYYCQEMLYILLRAFHFSIKILKRYCFWVKVGNKKWVLLAYSGWQKLRYWLKKGHIVFAHLQVLKRFHEEVYYFHTLLK